MQEPRCLRIDVRWLTAIGIAPFALIVPEAWGAFFGAAAFCLFVGVTAASFFGRKEKMTVGEAIARRHQYWQERKFNEAVERDLEAYSADEQFPLRALLRESGHPNLPLYPKSKGPQNLSLPVCLSQDYE